MSNAIKVEVTTGISKRKAKSHEFAVSITCIVHNQSSVNLSSVTMTLLDSSTDPSTMQTVQFGLMVPGQTVTQFTTLPKGVTTVALVDYIQNDPNPHNQIGFGNFAHTVELTVTD